MTSDPDNQAPYNCIIAYMEKKYFYTQDVCTYYNKPVYTKHVTTYMYVTRFVKKGLKHKILQMWKSITTLVASL